MTTRSELEYKRMIRGCDEGYKWVAWGSTRSINDDKWIGQMSDKEVRTEVLINNKGS